MARMNKTRPITGRPATAKPDTHSAAVAEAFEEGLAEFAPKLPDGRPMLFTSRQRAEARRRKAKAEA